MEYAGRMPHTPPQVAVFGVVALLAGAGGALGIAAIVDDGNTVAPEIQVVAAQPQPATPQSGHNEAATAAAVGTQPVALGGPNETATAAAVSTGTGAATTGGPDEATTASTIGG